MAPESYKTLHWYALLAAFILGCTLTYWTINNQPPIPIAFAEEAKAKSGTPCDYTISRVKGYEFVCPLLSAEPDCVSAELTHAKTRLTGLIDSLVGSGAINEASVYVHEFENGQRFAINPSARYHPASLMKIALLLSSLRVAEATPGLLTQKIRYELSPGTQISTQYYNYPSIQVGKEYSIHDLLYYMVANSDNHATWMLSSRLTPDQTPKLFFDLGLPKPVEDKVLFTMTAGEVSVFFKAIFNSSYLSPEYSDYAARLMSHCAFEEGFVKGFPRGTRMWHKFGEWRYAGYDYELHESGIVYLQEKPYLITVMTKGRDTDRQAQVISVIAKALHKALMEHVVGGQKVGSLPRSSSDALNP